MSGFQSTELYQLITIYKYSRTCQNVIITVIRLNDLKSHDHMLRSDHITNLPILTTYLSV